MFCGYFPANAKSTFTTLLSFHQTAEMLDDVSIATTDIPRCDFSTSLTLFRGWFPIQQSLTVPVAAMDCF